MIRVNTIINHKNWLLFLKHPENYIENRIKKFNRKFEKYKNKIIFCTLLLSGDDEIKKLNKKFRNKNRTTDVLSFPFYEKNDLRNILKHNKEIYLGDIIINLNKIENKNNKTNFRLEFNKLWIHGLVHLLGYDHKKNKDFYKMIEVEKKFISYLD